MTLSVDVKRLIGSMHLDVSFTVEAGETIAIVGPNGAGKSSLLRMIAGLSAADEGRITWNGADWDDASSGEFVPTEKRPVSYVFQDHALIPHLNVLDNVAFGVRASGGRRRVARERATHALSDVGSLELADRMPSELSGGESQTVAIARALATNPELMLFDEPFAALDAGARAQARRLFASMSNESLARILVTHDAVDALTLADRIVALESGSIVQVGTPSDVLATPRSHFVAEILGFNPLSGELHGDQLSIGAMNLTVGAHEVSDGPVIAIIRPRSVSLHRTRPEGSPRNVWNTAIAAVDRTSDRVRVQLGAPLHIAVEVTPAGFEALATGVGEELWASVKASEIAVHPA
jgi:molybdate transport system ATP-binding protein